MQRKFQEGYPRTISAEYIQVSLIRELYAIYNDWNGIEKIKKIINPRVNKKEGKIY